MDCVLTVCADGVQLQVASSRNPGQNTWVRRRKCPLQDPDLFVESTFEQKSPVDRRATLEQALKAKEQAQTIDDHCQPCSRHGDGSASP